MADDPASDDLPPRFFRDVLVAGAVFAGVAIAAAAAIDKPLWWWGDLLFPYPLIVLAAAPLIAWIAARLRHAPARSRTGLLVPWSWVIARFALMAANACLLVAWIVAELIGGPVAVTLLEAFILAAMARMIFFIAEQCAIDIRRAIRGPVIAAS